MVVLERWRDEVVDEAGGVRGGRKTCDFAPDILGGNAVSR